MNDSNLLQEAKAFQAIRILNIFYADSASKRSRYLENVSVELFDNIRLYEEFRFYIDAFFEITEGYYLNEISYQRRKVQRGIKKHWNKIDFDDFAISHPAYILLTSAFNESIDKSFRNALQVKNIPLGCRLEPISYYLYNPISFNEKYVFDQYQIFDKKFALLFFQIRDEGLVKFITDIDRLFDRERFQLEMSHEREYEIVAYGLLRGDIEGFILFDITNDKNDDIKDILSADDGMYSKFGPLSLFICKWDTRFEKKENFLQLKSIS